MITLIIAELSTCTHVTAGESVLEPPRELSTHRLGRPLVGHDRCGKCQDEDAHAHTCENSGPLLGSNRPVLAHLTDRKLLRSIPTKWIRTY